MGIITNFDSISYFYLRLSLKILCKVILASSAAVGLDNITLSAAVPELTVTIPLLNMHPDFSVPVDVICSKGISKAAVDPPIPKQPLFCIAVTIALLSVKRK